MINGIDYLKKMYPNRNEKDYQPSGMDLRLGKVYYMETDKDKLYGIYGGKKIIPHHHELKMTQVKMYGSTLSTEGLSFDKEQTYWGWSLEPNKPYICQVQEQIKIGENNAQFYLPRSTLLRAGVNVYTALGDLGYNGHLSFLVINHGNKPFFIEKGERFAQLVDFEVRGGSESYDGDYQEKEVIAEDWDMQNRIQF